MVSRDLKGCHFILITWIFFKPLYSFLVSHSSLNCLFLLYSCCLSTRKCKRSFSFCLFSKGFLSWRLFKALRHLLPFEFMKFQIKKKYKFKLSVIVTVKNNKIFTSSKICHGNFSCLLELSNKFTFQVLRLAQGRLEALSELARPLGKWRLLS